MIANIAGDDDLILPHSANPTGSNFRERQDSRGPNNQESLDLIARLSDHSTAPSGVAFRRPTTKITIHAIATSKRQPPTNMATRPGFSLTISPGRVGKISEVVAKLFHLCTNHINH